MTLNRKIVLIAALALVLVPAAAPVATAMVAPENEAECDPILTYPLTSEVNVNCRYKILHVD